MSTNIDFSDSIFGPKHWKGEMSFWISTALCIFFILAVFGASIPESLLDEQPKKANFTESENHTLAGITLEEVRDDDLFNISTPDSTTPDLQKDVTSTRLAAILPIVEEKPPDTPESPLALNATEVQTIQSQGVATVIPTTTASTQPITSEHPTTVIPPVAVSVSNLEKPIETETSPATSTAHNQADIEAITSSNTTTPERPTIQTKSDTEADNEVDRKGDIEVDIEATTVPTTTSTIQTTTSTIQTTTTTVPTTTERPTTTIAPIILLSQDVVTSTTEVHVPTIPAVATESPTTSTTTTTRVPTTVAFTTEPIRHLVPVTVWGVDESILRTTVKPRLSRPWFTQTFPTTTEENVVIIHAVIPPEATTIAPTSPGPVSVEDLSPSQKTAVKNLLESKRITSTTPAVSLIKPNPLPGFANPVVSNPRPELVSPFFIQPQFQTPPPQIQPLSQPLFPFPTFQTQRPLMTWQPIQTNFLPNGFNPQSTFLTHPGR